MTLYVRTTSDKYELPIAVAISIDELAQMLKVKYQTVSNAIYKKRPYWYKVEVEDE